LSACVAWRDLVARNVAVIIAAGGVASAPVAKEATSSIPIVFLSGADPIASGFVTISLVLKPI
jgi:ABC-type uncharacterized transport system substrate-binding protein